MKRPAFLTEDGKLRWHSSLAFEWQRIVFGWKLQVKMNRDDGFMGRLGGGWSWKLSILYSPSDIVLELFVMSIRFTKQKGAEA